MGWQPILDLLLDSKILLLNSEMESLFCFTSNAKMLKIYLCLYPTSQNIQARLLRKTIGPARATKLLSVPPKENLIDHRCVCMSGVCVHALVTQLCLTLCDPMDCSLPGSSVQGIIQARILEWVAIFLLQGIFLTQRSNPDILHCMQIFYLLSHQGNPKVLPYFTRS